MLREKVTYDIYATLSAFEEICEVAGNLRRQEVLPLRKKVKECPFTYCRRSNVRQYAYEDLYSIFTSHPIARTICEKHKWFNWEDVIYRYIVKSEDDRLGSRAQKYREQRHARYPDAFEEWF